MVTDGIHAVSVRQDKRIDNVTCGFTHLRTAEGDPAVAVDMLRQREIQRHQDRRPDERVETDDLFCHDMNVSRPVFLEIVIGVIPVAQSSNIVAQCIDPYIDDMLLIERYRNPPCKARSGDTEVFEARLDEVVDHLVYAGLRLEEISLLIKKQCFELIGESRELEEICLFFRIYDFTSAFRAFSILQLALGPERLARRAVLSDILALIDVSLIVQSLEDILDRLHMIRIGGSDKTVICDIKAFPEFFEVGNDSIHVLLRGHADFLCLLLDLLAMLIGTGQKHDIKTLHSLISGNYVACGLPDG